MTRAFPWLMLAAVAALAWFAWVQAQEDTGVIRQQIADTEARVAARDTVIAALSAQKARVDTVRLPLTARAFDKAAAYRKLRATVLDSVLAAIDTTARTYTVVMAADTAIAACTDALRVCGTAIAVRDSLLTQKDSLIWAKDSLIRLERKKDHCRIAGFIPCPSRTVAFLGGAVLGAVALSATSH